ncbi:hypothetical protein GpartN1_g5997.t1 [Galdieria partita]|uniref:Uncharacterized protein n=1 Tax=Galdieria partita TaxID=83374 RepID=A0A9C7Q2C2_9RHOD|nr:hypothetical protein GpartN1_g5997.t1 [Galdieria partita]
MACSFVAPSFFSHSNSHYKLKKHNETQYGRKYTIFSLACRKESNNQPPHQTTRREAISTLLSSAALGITLPMLLAEKVTVDKPEQLRKDVESLKYDEELILNPDPAEKDPLRYKPPPKEPEYRKQEQQLIKSEEEKYQNMVKEELNEENELRSKFGKPKK